jgi:hypothetical protein
MRMNYFKKEVAVVVLMSSVLLGSACGGPLSHKTEGYESSKVSPENQAKVNEAQAVAAQAKDEVEAAKVNTKAKKDAFDRALKNEEKKEADVNIAMAALKLEEVKVESGRDEDMARAKSKLNAAERAEKIAQAEGKLAKAEVELAERKEKEADGAWIVAMADVELVKFKAKEGSSVEYEEKHSDFRQQVAKAKEDLEKTKESTVSTQKKVDEAKEDLNHALTN